MFDQLPAVMQDASFGHISMLTKGAIIRVSSALECQGVSADKKTYVNLVNHVKVHYNRNVKGFRNMELGPNPVHPL